MSDVLRELLASFVVEVDKAGELVKGNAEVTALKARLGELQAEFAKVKAPAAAAGKAIRDALSPDDHVRNALASAAARARNSDAIAHLTGGGGGGGDGFLGAGLGAGKVTQFGPTRETMVAGRAAAEAYAKTLRGRLAGAVASVREAFSGGGGAKGPGLIATLGTVRNGLIALGVGTAVHAVKRLVDGIGDISEGAARLGVTTDEFQRMSAYARQNATDVDTLGTAFRTLATSAVDPSKESAAAFAKLGISVKDGSGQFKSSQDLFFETGEALAGVTNETERTELAQKLLGRSAMALKPMFAQGTEAFRKQREEMLKLKVLSPEVIGAADALSDSWVVLGTQLLATAGPVLQDVLFPALKALTGYLVDGIEWLGKFLKRTDLVAAGLTALAYVVSARLIPGLVSVIANGIAAAGSMNAFAASSARAAWSFARLIVGVLLLEDFITFLRGGDSEVGRMLDAVFGKGASAGTLQALKDLAGAIKDVWRWLNGEGVSAGTLKLWQDLKEALMFAMDLTPGDIKANRIASGIDPNTGGSLPQGKSDFELANQFGIDPEKIAKARGQRGITAPTGLGGGAGASAGGTTIQANGDRVVNITMGPSATAGDVGRVAGAELERDRNSLTAQVP